MTPNGIQAVATFQKVAIMLTQIVKLSHEKETHFLHFFEIFRAIKDNLGALPTFDDIIAIFLVCKILLPYPFSTYITDLGKF